MLESLREHFQRSKYFKRSLYNSPKIITQMTDRREINTQFMDSCFLLVRKQGSFPHLQLDNICSRKQFLISLFWYKETDWGPKEWNNCKIVERARLVSFHLGSGPFPLLHAVSSHAAVNLIQLGGKSSYCWPLISIDWMFTHIT